MGKGGQPRGGSAGGGATIESRRGTPASDADHAPKEKAANPHRSATLQRHVHVCAELLDIAENTFRLCSRELGACELLLVVGTAVEDCSRLLQKRRMLMFVLTVANVGPTGSLNLFCSKVSGR